MSLGVFAVCMCFDNPVSCVQVCGVWFQYFKSLIVASEAGQFLYDTAVASPLCCNLYSCCWRYSRSMLVAHSSGIRENTARRVASVAAALFIALTVSCTTIVSAAAAAAAAEQATQTTTAEVALGQRIAAVSPPHGVQPRTRAASFVPAPIAAPPAAVTHCFLSCCVPARRAPSLAAAFATTTRRLRVQAIWEKSMMMSAPGGTTPEVSDLLRNTINNRL